ncbi:transglutaminase-like domain-containing protein [Salinibacterium hongtaonis]|uniref:Transglutaminase domain-containing protein n=1 Tax=Homoserinimonas hongtaonis TaxID=2079791 RepID=A0A2U1SXD2_9MICO|nr:transglutaminase-like domain-containing protein [Salinibacterium hongtaonis]PWB96248.1 transglutaminase domain-containing protein [Salinibacterium hongtaonis]
MTIRPRAWAASFVARVTAFFCAAIGTAAAAFWPIYGDASFVLMAVVAILAGAALAILGARFRWSSPILLAATLLVYLLIGVPLAVPSQTRFGLVPTLEGFKDLILGTALGWKQLLTIALPVGSYQALLVPAFAVIFASSVVGLTIALRSKRGPLAVLVPVVVFVIGLLLGPREAAPAVVLALALFVVVLSWLSWERWYRRRESIRELSQPTAATSDATAGAERIGGLRTALSAVVILGLAIGVGGAAAVTADPARERTVLRDAIEQPFDPRDYPSPLSSLRKYHQAGVADSTMLTATGLPAGARIRLAALDTYDGVVFSVGTPQLASASGSFTRLPTAIQRDVPARGAEKTIEIDVVGYEGIWMPSVGLLSTVNFTGDSGNLRDSFFYNAPGNTAVVVGGLERGDAYSVDTVVIGDLAPETWSQLTPGTAVVPTATSVPDELTVALDGWVREAETPGERLAAMLSRLATEGYVSHGGPEEPFSRSGHGADRIEELLTAPRMIGDEEQYAVTAALMARAIGFPSRVVFGFAPDGDGVTRIVGSDVSAWIEVDTAQQGWVSIDPTPPAREIPDEQPEDPAQVARPQSPVPPPLVEQNTRPDQIPLDSEQEDEAGQDPLMAILLAAVAVLGVIALIVLIVLSPFLLIGAAKMRRRYLRQRAASSALRISGAWQEFEDMVLDYGYEPPASATRSEVAETVGGIQPLVLASVADRAVFAPETADDDEVRQVWLAVDELGAGLAHTRTRWQRVKAVMSLRSLGGYRVKGLFARERRLP